MIERVEEDRYKYLDLFLLGDESKKMIEKYINKGELYILQEKELIGLILITMEEENTYEIKNISIYDKFQRKGYGRKLIEFCIDNYSIYNNRIIVGTGDSPLTIPFYKAMGFMEYNRIKNFFIDNYDDPIYEEGVQLVDMVYLEYKRKI